MSEMLDPADLLDEDGKVDSTAVKSIANRDKTYTPTGHGAAAETCAAWREELKGQPRAEAIAADSDYSVTTVKEHVSGRCQHDHDTPPLEYHRNHHGKRGGIWKRPKDVSACPECDSASIKMASVSGTRAESDTHGRFRCTECQATFDEVTTRERKHDAETRKGLAGRLARADPDDVGAE